MKGRHTLIVGGTGGSGRALAQIMEDEGARVSVIGRGQRQINHAGRLWPVDLSDKENLLSTVDQIVEENGPLDHLVFFQRFRGDGDSWEGELAVSLSATRTLIEYFREKFAPGGDRSIVIIGSHAGHLVGDEQPVSYHVAKAGLMQMVRFYAVQLGEYGIRVNAVTPGTVIKEENEEFYRQNTELTELNAKITPLNRMGRSEDIARAVKFLLGSEAEFITGQNLAVDGGLSLLWQETLARKLTGLGNTKINRSAG